MSERRARILGIIGVVGALALWEAVARAGLINSLLLSSPAGIVDGALRLIESGKLAQHLWISFLEFALGMILATVIGVSLGLAAGWWRLAGYVIDPWLTILYSTPMVALAPLLILVFGIDLTAKSVIVFLFGVFPVAVNTLAGVQTTANRYLRVARSFSASQAKMLQTVVIPGSLPYVLTGLRVGGGHAIVGIVVAELLASDQGLGFLLSLAGATFQTGELLFLVTILGLGGMAYAAFLKRLEERMERWRPVVQRGAGARQ